jgi:beta-lactamase superfamily II metal-dependent hydrolase
MHRRERAGMFYEPSTTNACESSKAREQIASIARRESRHVVTSWARGWKSGIGAARLLAALLALAVAAEAGRTLDIYFIDVEGGQSTLIVTPAGQSLLIDTGFAGFDGRDSGRIVEAARAAGITRIDYLLLTHFHWDHDGGVVELARQMPIRTFIDSGDLDRSPDAAAVAGWPTTLERYNAYLPVRATGKHRIPNPGDRLSLKSVDVTFVSASAATITRPLPGAGRVNTECEPTAPPPSDAFENPRSIGIVLRFGRFRFLDVGDLSGPPLFALLCPRNLIGQVDVYLVPHHGALDVSYPATFAGLRPRVAIVNNGARKGGAPEIFDALRRAPALEGAWQLHRSLLEGAMNLPESQIANLDETTGHWVKVSAQKNGAFTVTNRRTGVVTAYD